MSRPAQVDPGHRREHAHRHDQDDRERQGQRFILRRQHHEHAQHRDREDDRGGVAGLLLLIGEAGPFEGEAGRKSLRRELLHRAQRIAGRDAGRRLALQLGGRIIVVARHLDRAAAVAEGRDRGERHHRAGRRAHLQPADIGEIVARRRLGLRGHPEGAAEQVEIVDVGRAEIGAERLIDLGRLDAEQLGAVAVDLGLDPGAAGVEQREDLADVRILLGGAHHREGRALERLIAGAARGPGASSRSRCHCRGPAPAAATGRRPARLPPRRRRRR